MCGIAVLLQTGDRRFDRGVIDAMTDVVTHRGPDGRGVEVFRPSPSGYRLAGAAGDDWTLALGHRRLSILDLSELGRQPMAYRDRSFITYNGEIYNFVELRSELEELGHEFRSRSDTEVALAAYDQWGVDCFARLRGMWGLVILDLRRRRLVLSRDRLGIKPLYTWVGSDFFAAASEIKQFWELPEVSPRAESSAIETYLSTGYEDSESTFFQEVVPVPAGTFRIYDLDAKSLGEPMPYWFPERVEPRIRDREDAARAFAECFHESTRLHLRSDVPVGCALSGGLDSSSIAGSVRHQANGASVSLETFSVTFPGESIDERKYMDRVVQSVRAEPHYVTPTPDELLEDLDDFLWKHDEPVGSVSQYAAYAVARLTREHGVPVTLNGQGGDEVLSGYWQCYFVHLAQLARELRLARLGKHLVGCLLPRGNPALLQQAPAMARRALKRLRSPGPVAGPVQQARKLAARDWRVYEVRELTLPRLLKWDDRNFMAFSVEGRYPFLDHELIELCLSFDYSVFFNRGWTKEPLRRGLADILPPQVARRRSKVGFETPQDRWLRGPLAHLVEDSFHGDAALWQWWPAQDARALLRRVLDSKQPDREDHQMLMRLFFLDRWLRRFGLS